MSRNYKSSEGEANHIKDGDEKVINFYYALCFNKYPSCSE